MTLNPLSKPAYFAVFCIVIVLFILGSVGDTNAQEKLNISGSVNGSGIGYAATGIPARRDPFYWLLSGNLTLSYWQSTAPFSFTVSQQDQTLRYPQPFNQFGVSPTYKFITLHLGYRSMNFSEFTLAGPIFMGVGAEVTPPNSLVKVSAMYGRLAKARLTGSLNDLEFGVASYERWGFGSKITVGKNGQEVDFIFFRGKDDATSIPDTTASKLKISPAENFVWGLNVRKNIGRRLSLNTEFAQSAYTMDTRNPEVDLESHRYANHLGNLFTPTISSQFNAAFQGQLSYKAELFQVNFKYRRLGPEYKTMGSPFMNNDFEDITGGIATAFFKNRLSVSTNAGVQRNNLNHDQETRVTRFIGAVNTSYTVNEKLNVSIGYSNFSSSTKLDRFYQQSQIDQVDSLLYLQVTNSLNGNVNYSFQTGEISKTLMLGTNYQIATDNSDNKSVFYNVNVGYQLTHTPRDFNLNSNINLNSNAVAGLKNLSAGPTVTASKLFFNKKFKSNVSTGYIQSFQSGELINSTLTTRLGCSYATKSKHTFGLDFSWLQRSSKTENAPTFSEFRGGVTYNYSFSN